MRGRKVLWSLAVLAAVLALAAVALGFARTRHEEGGLGPVISPDGKFVYFVRRATSGFVWGLGVESFTPPAHARIWSDSFELCRVPLEGGRGESVGAWRNSPLEGTSISEYRGRVFSIAHAVLRFAGDRLDYQVSVTLPQSPQSITWALDGRFDPGSPARLDNLQWTRRFSPANASEDMVREPWEVLAVPGRESFPCAIAAHNFQSGQLRVLWKTSACDSLYPGGIRWEQVSSYSRAKDIVRARRVRQVQRDLVAEARSRGQSEVQALLSATRQLQDMGYYPTPPRLIARPLRPSTERREPLFRISEDEFKAGLFPDIANAIASPGAEVDKDIGRYVVDERYTTSMRLNDYLASGGQKFYVDAAGRRYELTLTPRRPAVR